MKLNLSQNIHVHTIIRILSYKRPFFSYMYIIPQTIFKSVIEILLLFISIFMIIIVVLCDFSVTGKEHHNLHKKSH